MIVVDVEGARLTELLLLHEYRGLCAMPAHQFIDSPIW